MVKSNGSDINDDEILSDVEIVYALAKIKHFKDIVQTVSIKRYSQEEGAQRSLQDSGRDQEKRKKIDKDSTYRSI